MGKKALAKVHSLFPTAQLQFEPCDVSNEQHIQHVVAVAVRTWGKLNIMFNNAGIMHPSDDDAITTPEDVWDLTMRINVKGVWYGCKAAIQAMRQNPIIDARTARREPGSVINTASFVGLMGAATAQLAYTSSKGAVLAMTRELAMIHARENIRFNSLCPGPLHTPLLMDFLNTEEKKQRRLVHLPMGRFGEAIEQAWAVVWLASEESSYVTGQELSVDGGLTRAYVTPTGDTSSLCPHPPITQL